LPIGKRFETQRGAIRQAMARTATGKQIESEVAALLK